MANVEGTEGKMDGFAGQGNLQDSNGLKYPKRFAVEFDILAEDTFFATKN